jgi:hypothetical protein
MSRPLEPAGATQQRFDQPGGNPVNHVLVRRFSVGLTVMLLAAVAIFVFVNTR